MSSRGGGGGIVHTFILHPIKSFLGFLGVLAVAIVLLLPPADAIATFGAVAVTSYRVVGVVFGTIPVGIESFKEGFKAMANYEPKDSGWSKAAGGDDKAPSGSKTLDPNGN